jgi:hypothetical protein
MNTGIKLLLFAIIILGCSNYDSPKNVAEEFLSAFSKHDFQKAAAYGTKETNKLLKQLDRIEQVEKEKMQLPSEKINIISEEIQGNKAIVYFKEEGSNTEEKLHLVKVNVGGRKEWRVMLSKTDVKIPLPFNGPAVGDSTVIKNL